ncbi:MAG: hypothetical protein IJL77_05650, partial [Clostridia bacterium]|nr:hypothetical protein [Clostridia bacterium]
PDSDDCYTFHWFKPEEYHDIIDFIFVDKNAVEPVNFKVVNKKYDGRFYSDHFAVYTDVKLK